MAKPKANKKSIYKPKKTNSVHPHIECIQAEITRLEDKLNSLEQLENLTAEENQDKQATQISLLQTQNILTKLTEPSMLNKLRSHHDITDRDTREKGELMILSLLQLFYMMRLGQLGLFDYVQPAATQQKHISKAISDLCDQMVGASVYYAVDKSNKTRSENRSKALQLLKQFDTCSDDLIIEGVSFKDVKHFIQHVWNHTVDENQLENTNQDDSASSSWAVLQFNNMMDPIRQSESALLQDDQLKETVQEELPVINESTSEDQSTKDNETTTVESNQCLDGTLKENEHHQDTASKETENQSSSQGWDVTPKENERETDSWRKDVSWETATWNGDAKVNKKSKRVFTRGHTATDDRNVSWDKSFSANKYGWNTVDNSIKGDGWEDTVPNVDNDKNWTSSLSEPVVVEQVIVVDNAIQAQVTTPPASPKQQQVDESTQESRQRANSESNDDWRRRSDAEFGGRSRGSGRGSGRGSNSRGGKFRGRGRGRGSVFVRGRGKGRGRDYDAQPKSQPHD